MDMFLVIGGENKGPYKAEQVKRMLESGEVSPTTMAWLKGARAPVEVHTVIERQAAHSPFSKNAAGNSDPAKVSSIGLDIVLTIITLGFFNVYIQYRQITVINEMLGV